MSGSLPREQRRVLPQGAGVQDTSAGLRIAGAAAASSEARLAESLQPLAREVAREAAQEAIRTGEEAAANTPMVRDETGRLVIPEGQVDATPLMTRAQTRRREALLSRYASELTLDVNRDVLRLRDQHRDDPEAFRTASESWRRGLVEGLPVALRGVVGERAGQVIGQHYAHALDRRSQEDRAAAAELSRQSISVLGAEVSQILAAGGDPTEALARLNGKIDGDARVLGPGEAERLRRHYTIVVPAQAGVRRSFEEAGAEGGPALVAALRSGDAGARRRAIIAGFERAGYAEQNRAGSQAFGRYQITPGFYATLRQQDASLPSWEEFRRTPQAQERAMEVALGHYEREAQRRGITFDDRVALGMHFLGVAGYAQMRAAAERDPSAPASRYVSEEAIRQNGQIFRTREGRVRSVGEVMAGLNARVPNFEGLSEQERRAILAAEDDVVIARRAEEQRVQTAARQQRTARVGAITQRLAEIEDATPAEADLSPELLAEQAPLTEELETLARADGDEGGSGARGAQAAVQRAGRARAETTAVGRRAASDRAAALGAAGIATSPDEWRIPTPEQMQAQATIARLDEEARDLTATERARFWRQARRQIEGQLRTAREGADEDDKLADAWAGGARLPNNAQNQDRGMAWLRGQGVTTLMEPNAPAAVNHLARTGVVPQRVMNFMWGAIQSGDPASYEQAAEIHRRMIRDPLVEERYRSAVDERVRNAFRGVPDALAALPQGEARAARVLQLVESSRRIAQGDPTTLQEMRATLGGDTTAQNRAIASAVDEALRERSLPTRVPAEMREDLNTAFLHILASTGDRGVAAREAVREVTASGWTSMPPTRRQASSPPPAAPSRPGRKVPPPRRAPAPCKVPKPARARRRARTARRRRAPSCATRRPSPAAAHARPPPTGASPGSTPAAAPRPAASGSRHRPGAGPPPAPARSRRDPAAARRQQSSVPARRPGPGGRSGVRRPRRPARSAGSAARRATGWRADPPAPPTTARPCRGYRARNSRSRMAAASVTPVARPRSSRPRSAISVDWVRTLRNL